MHKKPHAGIRHVDVAAPAGEEHRSRWVRPQVATSPNGGSRHSSRPCAGVPPAAQSMPASHGGAREALDATVAMGANCPAVKPSFWHATAAASCRPPAAVGCACCMCCALFRYVYSYTKRKWVYASMMLIFVQTSPRQYYPGGTAPRPAVFFCVERTNRSSSVCGGSARGRHERMCVHAQPVRTGQPLTLTGLDRPRKP